MSTEGETHQYPDSPPKTHQSPRSPATTHDSFLRDVVLWRKKKISASVLAAATATWVLLEIYQYNFLTVVSWVALAGVVLMFVWGNLHRLLGKQVPDSTFIGIPEDSALKIANEIRRSVEQGLRWLFRMGAESEWYEFAGVVGALYLTSLFGTCCNLLTLLYMGVVMGLTVPVIYQKNEDKIKRCLECMKMKGREWYNMLDEEVLRKIKRKLGTVEKKEKKVE